MGMKKDHQDIITMVTTQFSDIYHGSTQGVYIFLDDFHYSLNEHLLGMLGYDTIDEILSGGKSLLQKLVAPASQEALVTAYQRAMQEMAGSILSVSWLKKSGKILKTSVILVPISFQDHLLAYHFVETVKGK